MLLDESILVQYSISNPPQNVRKAVIKESNKSNKRRSFLLERGCIIWESYSEKILLV